MGPRLTETFMKHSLWLTIGFGGNVAVSHSFPKSIQTVGTQAA